MPDEEMKDMQDLMAYDFIQDMFHAACGWRD
jgi:hypothetical protein